MSNSRNYFLKPGGFLKGEARIPGDKSISHRAVMLGSIAEGITEVTNFLAGADCLATVRAFESMGVNIEKITSEKIIIHGVGLHGLKKPKEILDLGNSGTSIRLLSGLLAGQEFDSELTGDESLQKRPMARIAEPLRLMGAKIDLTNNNFPPIFIHGKQKLKNIEYVMPIASAQVKSCLLLASLYAAGKSKIIEPIISRDHTEKMLQTFNYDIAGQKRLFGTKITVPSDISSAAFFIVGASIAKNSDVILKQVGINPTRTGILDILKSMGADIRIFNQQMFGAEPVADLQIKSANLKGIKIPQELVPLAIDEFPIIFIAAACASGTTIIEGAEELRHKESDRLKAMTEGLKILGIEIETTREGAVITGGTMGGGRINSYGDHRIAMAFAMAALCCEDEVIIENCENVVTSFPNFVEISRKLGLKIE